MKTLVPTGAALITVLGAQPQARTALCQALRVRLAARGMAAVHLPCRPPPEPFSSHWLQDCVSALSAAPPSSMLLLHESSVVHAAAGTATSNAAPSDLQIAAQAELARSEQVFLCAAPAQGDAAIHTLDGLLRQSLLQARTHFCVIHGTGPSAEAQAWQVLCLALGWPLDAERDHASAARRPVWRGACDKCSDPGCEHRVFSDLIAQRTRS